MVANIRTGNNFYGAASYNQVKVKKGAAAILYSQNLRGTTLKAIEKRFKNLTNSNIKKPVFHASLSFEKEDKAKLTNEKILKITQNFFDETGYGVTNSVNPPQQKSLTLYCISPNISLHAKIKSRRIRP